MSKLDKILGNGEKLKDVIYGLQLLNKQNKISTAELATISQKLEEISKVNSNLSETNKIITTVKELIDQLATKESETKVNNFPSVIKAEVVNYPQAKDIQEVSLAQPKWYKQFNPLEVFKELAGSILTVKILNKKPDEAVPVRLTNGFKFYEAIMSAVAGGVGLPFAENGEDSQAQLVNGRVQVDVLTAPPVTVDTTGLATSINQTNGQQSVRIVDDANNGIPSFVNNSFPVHVTGNDVNLAQESGGNLTEIKDILTNNLQVTQLVDADGNFVAVTNNKLDVNASIDTTGLATEAKQDAIIADMTKETTLQSVLAYETDNNQKLHDISTAQSDNTQTTKIVNTAGDAVTVTGNKLDVNASIDTTGLATSTKQDDGITLLTAIDNKLVSGTDIGDVTINNGTGAGAVNIQDGGNTITVDGGVTAVATGDIASGATDSGNPVKVGGVYTTTPGTLLDGQRSNMQFDNKGSIKVTLMSNNNTYSMGNMADNVDGVTVSANARNQSVMSRNTVFNGTSWDRMPGDTTGIKIQDGGNSITVDGTVSANATLAAETTKVIGTVNVAGSQTIAVTNATAANLKVDLSGTAANATAVKVNVASGGIASGAIASGAIASGAFAIGSMTNVGVGTESAAVGANGVHNVGGTAITAPKTLTHNGDAVGYVADLSGRQIVLPYSNPENSVAGATSDITGTTATTIIAGVASNYLYITQILVTNSHATVGTFVNITEETSGTVLQTGYAAPLGGGFSLTFPTPLRVPTAAKALQATCVTTGSNVRVSASGYKLTV